MSEARFVEHLPCPSCGSSDALALYDDGHTYCFSCRTHKGAAGEVPKAAPRRPAGMIDDLTYGAIRARALTEETCAKYGYGTGKHRGKAVQVANYRRDGRVIAQKVRTRDKNFYILGEGKNLPLYGSWLYKTGGKRVVVTEGEIDALSMAQVQDLRWPVVSVPNGAAAAAKDIANSIEWLEQFEQVVIMFDSDEPGMEAAVECARLLTPGKARIARLPRKDANEMLVAGEVRELMTCMWEAPVYRPDGLVRAADLRDEVVRPVEWGLPWPWDTLTQATYGRRLGEVYVLGAGTGVGKTDLFTQIMAHTVMELKQPIGVYSMEQSPVETLRRIAGKVAGKPFHVPGADWSEDDLVEAVDRVVADDRITLYDNWGATEWPVLASRITYLAHAGVRHHFVDNLTALAAAEDDERKALEHIMADAASLAKRLGICLYMVSHLATPEGKSHEEGGRVTIRHLKGSRAIGFWASFIFAMERNQQADDEVERHTTTFRILKDRYTGRSTGTTFRLHYEADTGEMVEAPAEDCPFPVDTEEAF